MLVGDTALQLPFLAEEYDGLLEMLELDDASVMPWCENTRSAQTESSCPELPFSHCDYKESAVAVRTLVALWLARLLSGGQASSLMDTGVLVKV
ncbi:hypothetical protein EK904_013714 [Melospiza melodia maxima]|nr:hypothetical protein EK904_013714 [Melospiza melodia maxima]